jgi:hypothetical protein
MALVGLLVGAAQLVVALIAVIGVASKPHPCSRSHNHRLQGQFWLPQLNTRGGILSLCKLFGVEICTLFGAIAPARNWSRQ